MSGNLFACRARFDFLLLKNGSMENINKHSFGHINYRRG